MTDSRLKLDTVFFLSDYGLQDEFVGVVHAVIRRLAPQAKVIDLNHGVPPFDVAAGAASLARALPHLGPGVVLAVVDPGVGTRRRPVAVRAGTVRAGRWFVGPDNGLLTEAVDHAGGVRRVIELQPGEPLAIDAPATFDGRDLFAPAVARICNGEVEALGVESAEPALVRLPSSAVEPGELIELADGRVRLRSVVTWVDRFGNAQLSAASGQLPGLHRTAAVSVSHEAGEGGLAATVVRRVRAFADLGPGEPGVLVDANGRLALVVREGSAADRFGVVSGTVVDLIW